ncbi:MAG: pyridoxamine 5'-phosphate oxidase family protein [Pseudomonadota bacterium]|nr:pyridoxamine 5'-phosphate oxidase family protein [Pseudomonadota bacterium]
MTAKPDKTARHRVKRAPKRAGYDRDSIHDILDAGKICHVGFCIEEQPYVIPMAYARDGDRMLLHGSSASRLMKTLGAGIEACVTVTHLDGMVLARSTFHHSMNYRSVVAFGEARLIEDEMEKRSALDLLVEHLTPGRTAECRAPNAIEMKATHVLMFHMRDVSAKVRTGPPVDDDEDLAMDVWAGTIPLTTEEGEPESAPDLKPGIAIPRYLR